MKNETEIESQDMNIDNNFFNSRPKMERLFLL